MRRRDEKLRAGIPMLPDGHAVPAFGDTLTNTELGNGYVVR